MHLTNLGNSVKLSKDLVDIFSQFDSKSTKKEILATARDSLKNTLKGYSDEVIESAVATAKLTEAGANAVYSMAGFTKEAQKTAVRMTTLSTVEGIVATATSRLATAFAGLKAMISPFIVPLAITGTVVAALKVFDSVNVTIEEQIEKNKELADSYAETESNIASIESELDRVQTRMKELESAGPLSITDNGELTRLKEENRLLENKLAIEKQIAAQKADELNQGIESAYKKDFQDKNHSYFMRNDGYVVTFGEAGEGQLVNGSEEEYLRKVVEQTKVLIALGDKRNEQQEYEYQKNKEILSEAAERILTETAGYQAITAEQKKWVADRDDLLGLISMTLDPAEHIANRFNEVWNDINFKNKQKDLIELSKSGKLNPEIISQYDELNELLDELDITAQDLVSHIQSQYPIEEIIDPELTIERALDTYAQKGYSPEWINQRLQTIRARKELTDAWKVHGGKEGQEYAILTVATLILVVGVYVFKFPNNFSFGGVTGIAVVLSAVMPATPGNITFIINMALLVVGFIFLGKSFGIRTVYVSFPFSC